MNLMSVNKYLWSFCVALFLSVQTQAQEAAISAARATTETEYMFSYASARTPKPNDGYAPPIAYNADPIVIHPGIYVGAEQIGAGSMITAIEPLVLWKKNTKVATGKIFVWDVQKKNMIREQEATFRLGYNRINLTEPIKVEEGQELFVGYQLSIPVRYDEERGAYMPTEYPIGCDYDHPTYSYWRGHGILTADGVEYKILDKSSSFGNLALNVYFSLPTASTTDPLVFPLKCSPKDLSIPFSEIGSKRTCALLLRNASREPISQLTLQIAGVQGEPIQVPLSTTLAANAETMVTFDYPVQQGGVLRLSIPQVDGHKNALSGATSFELGCYKPNAKRPTKPLLEVFVGEWSFSCTKAEEELAQLYESSKGTDREFNYYCIHDEDAFAIPESFVMSSMVDVMYYPSARVNRFPYRITDPKNEGVCVPIINRAAWSEALDQAIKSGASFYDIQMSGVVDKSNPHKFSVEIAVERLFEDFFTDNRLVVALVEDQVLAKQQVLPDGSISTDFRHPNVLRRFCNGINGEPLHFSDNKATKRIDIEIPREEVYSGSMNNFKVIAFIARPYDNLFGSQQIFDSQSIDYRMLTGIESPLIEERVYRVSADHGWLSISGGEYDRYDLYEVSGANVQEPLSQGAYVIRIWDQGTPHITKVIIP